MCLIIAQYAYSDRLSKEDLLSAYKINNDGIGVAYSLNMGMFSRKGFADFEEFYYYYSNIPPQASILTHFRKTSAGDNGVENLHPFKVNPNLYMAFNGTITNLVFKDTPRSDTYIFNELILKKLSDLNPAFYKSTAIHKLLAEYIGNSKLVFLDPYGDFTIINSILGEWNEDNTIWISNTLWKNKKTKSKEKSCNSCNTTPPFKDFTPPNQISKKKFYKIGDPFYKELTESQIRILMNQYCVRGVNKLLKRNIIGKLSNVSDNTKYQAFLAYTKTLEDSSNNTFGSHSAKDSSSSNPKIIEAEIQVEQIKSPNKLEQFGNLLFAPENLSQNKINN